MNSNKALPKNKKNILECDQKFNNQIEVFCQEREKLVTELISELLEKRKLRA